MGGVAWTEEEDHLLRKCVEQYGEGKWYRVPLLAASRLPGRTANDVKNYWNCHLSKKLNISNDAEATKQAMTKISAEVIKPWAHRLVASSMLLAHTDAASGCKPPQEDVASTSVGLPYAPSVAECDQTPLQKDEQDEFACIKGPGNENELGMDFLLDEIKMMGEEHCKSKWDLDDLMMDVELWGESL
ncbi:hypothetical protein Ancab_000348 [Ancistrocladus abbreviatus]